MDGLAASSSERPDLKDHADDGHHADDSRIIAVISVSETGKWLSPWMRPASVMASRSWRRPSMNCT